MEEQIARHFGRLAPTYDQVGPQWFAPLGWRLVDLAQVPVGGAVLDVATGRGAVLFAAAERVGAGGYITGIDISEDMLRETAAEIERRGVRNAQVRWMDAQELQFAGESFDRVLCAFALFFFPRLDRALSEFRRVLKPGGVVAVSTWGEYDPRWTWYVDLLKEYGLSQVQLTSQTLDKPADLEWALAGAGFAEVRVSVEAFDFLYADEEEWWAKLWAHQGQVDLEGLEPDRLAAFKADAFRKLQASKGPDGLSRRMQVLFGVGTRG